MMTDNNGNKEWEGEFLPFGEEYSITGTIKNNLRFPGQYYDEETGLTQNWHRDYKKEMGRYIEKDPAGFQGGLNLYIYANNNSVVNGDPSGLKVKLCSRQADIPILGAVAHHLGWDHQWLRTDTVVLSLAMN